MKKHLMMLDLDGTLINRGSASKKYVDVNLLSDFIAALRDRDIAMELIMVSSSCYESAHPWLNNIPPSLFSALYFENGAVKKTDNSLALLIDEKPGEIEDIRGALESYIQKNPSLIRTVSRKKFTIAIECSSASNLLVVERDLTRLMSEKKWEVTCSNTIHLELTPQYLKKNFALGDWLKTGRCYEKIWFIGDKFFPTGNDFALLEDDRVDIAVEVATVEDTYKFLKNISEQKFIVDIKAALNHTTARIAKSSPSHISLNEYHGGAYLPHTDPRKDIFFDFDGTLTDSHGRIEPRCVSAMRALSLSGHRLWVITGRSFGWCDALVQTLPLHGILGENGAFALYWSDGNLIQWISPHLTPGFMKRREKLRMVLENLGYPIRWASDQNFRCYDLAVVTNEHGWVMDEEHIEALAKCCAEYGAQYSLSSIHMNIWFGSYSKASSLVHFMADTQQVNAAELAELGMFFGDSANDESMFRLIEQSYAAANIADFLPRLRYRPKIVSREEGGLGTVQLLKSIFPSEIASGENLLLVPSSAPRYSLVVPCFGSFQKLHNMLLSVVKVAERYTEKIELILVDNNSASSSNIAALVENFRKKIHVLLIHQPELPSSFALCSARNRGVQNARGEYVFFTDADCMLAPDFFSRLDAFLEALPDKGPSIVTGERVFVRIPETLQHIDTDFFENLPRCPSRSNYGLVEDRRFPWMRQLPDVAHPWNFVHGCFFVIRRVEYLALNGSNLAYDGHWGYEDIDLAWRAATQLNAKIYFCPNVSVFHQEFESDLENLQENNHRFNKQANPNWHRICASIPGFEAFKAIQFSALGISPTTQ